MQTNQTDFTRDELALIHNVFSQTQWTPDKALACTLAAAIVGKTAARVQAIDRSNPALAPAEKTDDSHATREEK